MIRRLEYPLHDLFPYINWLYFFHAWGMPPRFATIAEVHDCPACRNTWVNRYEKADRAQAVEAERLYRDAVDLLRSLDGTYTVKVIFGLFPTWSEGDDIVVRTSESEAVDSAVKSSVSSSASLVRLPFLRQQKTKNSEPPFLCLSDFIAPYDFYYKVHPAEGQNNLSSLPRGTILGAFAAAVDSQMESLFAGDDYCRMLLQTLCDRLAEAATEKMHEEVRRNFWGYSPTESFSPQELFSERYQGRRPAVGYPSIPDQSVNFLIDRLIEMDKIGIKLTSNGMMQPHAAVSGFLFDHPAARHFSVGAIGEDQLEDYASRRNMPVEDCKKFLSRNLRKD